MTVRVSSPDDLGAAAILAVADGAGLELSAALLDGLAGSRQHTVEALAAGGPVYGVTTGMGNQSHLAVEAEEQPSYQDDLMLARAVGGPPWLSVRAVRAATAARLRTLLEPEAGISPALATALAALLAADVQPAVPATGNGAAGEIIPLAHLGGFLCGRGEGVVEGGTRPATEALREAGLTPYTFGAKEGVAFLQGIPVALGQAVLVSADARLLARQHLAAAAAELACVRAPRDPFHPALSRGDEELSAVHAALLELAGPEAQPRMLQAPVSFRVVGPALAHLLRALRQLDEAVHRALTGVSTSPALVDDRFLGTAGFDGFDLAACADAVGLALLHVAEVGGARLHRMLDPRVTGLPPQLSAAPGRQAGLVALHKRVVGVLHEARRAAAPASLGSAETSLGQEDVQSFTLEATGAAGEAVTVLRRVTAAELLAVHQATLLESGAPRGTETLQMVLHKAFDDLGRSPEDRRLGPEVAALEHRLGVGWGHDRLDIIRDALSESAHTTP